MSGADRHSVIIIEGKVSTTDDLRALRHDGGVRTGEVFVITGGTNGWSAIDEIRLRINEQNKALAREAGDKDATFLFDVEVDPDKVKQLIDDAMASWEAKISARRLGKTRLTAMLNDAMTEALRPLELHQDVSKKPRRNGKQKRNPDRWK